MGKILSRSDSSTKGRRSRVYEHESSSYNRVVQPPYGSNTLSSTTLIRPSTVPHRSNTTSFSSAPVATRTSSNSGNKVTLPPFDFIKPNIATNNVSQRRSNESQFVSVHSHRRTANANDSAEKYPGNTSKPTQAENNATKASDFDIFQSTPTPEGKQTTRSSSSSSMKTGDMDKLVTSTPATNLRSDTVKPRLASNYPVFKSESFSTRTQHSSASIHNRAATTPSVFENTVNSQRSTKTNTSTTQISNYLTDSAIPSYAPAAKLNTTKRPYYNQEYSEKGVTVNVHNAAQKSSISKTWKTETSEIIGKYGSVTGEFRTQKMREPTNVDELTTIEQQKQTCTGITEKPAPSVPASFVKDFRKEKFSKEPIPSYEIPKSYISNLYTPIDYNPSRAETDNATKASDFDIFQSTPTPGGKQTTRSSSSLRMKTGDIDKLVTSTPATNLRSDTVKLRVASNYPISKSESFSTRTQHSSASIHNRAATTPSVFENTVNSQRSTKTNTSTTQISNYLTNSAIPSFASAAKLNTTKRPYYNQEYSEKGVTVNVNNAAQKSSISKTWKTETSEIIGEYGSLTEEFRTQKMREPTNVDELSTIEQQKQTCTGITEKPAPCVPASFVKDFRKEKFSKEPIPSYEIPKSCISNLYTPIDYIPSRSVESEHDVVLHRQFYLQNFTIKLETSPKDKRFKPENDVIYHNQWTKCSAQIINEFNGTVRSQHTVNVSSGDSHFVDIRDSKVKKGRLHFTIRSCQTGNISVFVKIDDFTITKNLHVSFNPCSGSLSEMTIVEADPAQDTFVFRIFLFDVFGEPVPPNSTVNLEVDASFYSTENEEVVNSEIFVEQEQLCYDITVRGERAWSLDLSVFLNGEELEHPQELEFTDEECNVIKWLDEEDYDGIKEFFEESDCGLTIPFTTGEDDGVFVAYDENDCKIQSQNGKNIKLLCKNVRKYDILGPDFAHINNIKRVLELKDRIEIQENEEDSIIDLGNIKSQLHPICKEVVEHLLRGLYYRWKASEVARIRMEWKNRLLCIEEVMFLDAKSLSLVLCKYFKDFFGALMNRYNREACDELFDFFNFYRDEGEVDLHGLLVADEEKLKLLRLNLMSGSLSNDQIIEILKMCKIRSKQGRERRTFRKEFRRGKISKHLVQDFIAGASKKDDDDLDVDAIITRCRLESDEAIRKLKDTLDNFNIDEAIENSTPWLEIIVGAGRHSRKKEQNIRPKVEKLLKERKCKFDPVNKGSLVVTYQDYDGPQPCFGE